MRYGLPLIHCLSEDARAKMLGKITDRDCLPDCHWEPWLTSEQQRNLSYYYDFKAIHPSDTDLEYIRLGEIGREMMMKPDRPKRIK